MTQVNRDNANEYEVHKWTSMASDLGLRAGEWPTTLTTQLGNGQPFLRQSMKLDDDGDLQWVTYWQACGCLRLRVYND